MTFVLAFVRPAAARPLHLLRRLARGLSLSLVVAAGQASAAETVTVFAAASLQTALSEVSRQFTTETGTQVRFSFAASSALARQLEQGAPADAFVSADVEWMEYVTSRNLIRPDSRVDLLGNTLVMIAPRDAATSRLELARPALAAALGSGRLATGETSSVPAGRYAKAALESLGLWADLQPRLAQAENVRAALLLVSRGEAPLGIVYATDAAAEPGVKVVATFPAGSHPPIIYPFALTTKASAAAAEWLVYLRRPEVRRSFERQGFALVERP